MQRWFLSYNSQDVAIIEGLESALRRKDADAQIFFAPKALRAGGYWLPALSEAIANATAFVLVVGEKGLGPWQVIEYYEALDKRVKAPDFPLVFVLLEGQPAPGLPFLRQLHWTITPDPSSEDCASKLMAATAGGESQPGELWRYTAPYRGLAAMTETDSDFFFGRSRETVEILKTIAAMPDRLPLLLGNSGVGKSSLAQAGVLASLKRQAWPEGNETTGEWPAEFRESRHWCYLKFTPGTEPLKALVESFLRTWQLETTDPIWEKRQKDWIEALLNGDATMRGLMDATERRDQELGQPSPPAFFLYIDQGEELYVRSEERQARRFSDLVSVGITDPRLRAIMSLRSDFFGALQNDEKLYAAHRQINVPPLREAELREVVSRPAELLSARFETPALATDMARRTAQESAKDAGALPLLSYLLDDMWTQMVKRGDGVLRVPPEAFELGGVLADRANAFLASHPKAEEQLRKILTLKLATVREDGEPTRRRALRSEFSDEEWRLVSELSDHPHRLLVTAAPEAGETYAEVAHEAIFRRWDKLREWMAAERDFLVWKSGLEGARRSWEQASAPTRNDALLMGLALAQAHSWLVRRAEDLPKSDREFIDQSLQRETLERHQKESLRRRVLVTAVVALVAVTVLAGFSLLQWRAAEQQRTEAVKQEQLAKAASALAEEERHRAEEQRAEAVKQEQVAKAERARAEEERHRAEEQRLEAVKQEQAAQHERTRAEQALATATQIANTLVFDMMSNFRDLGLPIELIHKMLDRAIQSYDQAIRLNPKSFATYNARGSAYWNKGDYDRAIADYDKAIELNPTYPYAYNNRGLAYHRKKEYDRAIPDFDKAIELDPKYASAYSGRASVYRDKGDYDRAIADYTKAVELNPRYALAYNSRGYAYSLKKDFDGAIADYSRAIKLDPKYAVAYLNRGLAYAGKRDYDRAIADYNQALLHNPKYAFAYNNRGLAYNNKKDHDRAIADYDQAIRLDPKYSAAYNNRGIAYYDKRDYDRAIDEYNEAVKIDPKYAAAHNNRGNAWSAKRDHNRAIADYDKAIEIDPKYAFAYNNRGLVYSNKHDYDRAIADYDQAIKFDPTYTFAYNNRGLAYAAKNNYDRAILDYNEALKLDPSYVFAYRNRARAYYEKSDHDRAIADYDKAIELDPKSVSTYNARGNAYFAKHDYDRAIADYEEAIKVDPKYAFAHHNRALAFANKGDYDRAIAGYDEAIRLDPKYTSALNNRGFAYYSKRDYQRAIADYDEAIKLNPKFALAYNNRGNAHSAAGNHDRAIADYDEAIGLSPKYTIAYANRGNALRRKGDYDRALASYDQAIAIDSKYVTAHNGRGFAQFGKGDFPAAAADFLRAIEIEDDAEAMLWRYLARARAGEDAIAELKANSERLKSKDWPYAVIEFYSGQRSSAQLLSAAKGEQGCVAQFFLGQWHVLHRSHAQAAAALRNVSEKCPKTLVQYDIALVELKRLNP